MPKYKLTTHPAEGFKSVWRAGRPWPKEGTIIEVVDSKEDPGPKDQPSDGTVRIGQDTWAALQADPRCFVSSPDAKEAAATSAALAQAQSRIAELEAEIARLKAESSGKRTK